MLIHRRSADTKHCGRLFVGHLVVVVQGAKNESISLQQELEKRLSHPVYVISEPPFWKVRIGNFRTRDEANQYKQTLLDLYPELQSGTYVVPDKVIVLH